MKKIIPIVMAFSALISISFGYEKIYDLPSEEKTITSGVTYQTINRFTTTGWININLIKADLENDNVKVDLLTPTKGMYNIDTVLNQAVTNNAVVILLVNKVSISSSVTFSPYFNLSKKP